MFKILYAAGNGSGSKIQLTRFLYAIAGKPYIIKIAAYKKSSPININIDWTLDCLLNMFNPEHISLDNDNLKTYFDQIKYFSPDLIISDLEYFTSFIANELNITLWQCSSSIINFALPQRYKYDLGVYSKYAYLLNKNPTHTQRMVNIIDNSNCNFVYSHFCDVEVSPPLKDNYEWIRPYYSLGKEYVPCQHNIVAGLLSNNNDIIDCLKSYSDCVVFSEFSYETFANLLVKNIQNEEEYFCNLKNSNLMINEGQTSFLADAFYNKKYSIVYPDIESAECIINAAISERLNLSTSIYNSQDLSAYINVNVPVYYNENIKFLHEKIEIYDI